MSKPTRTVDVPIHKLVASDYNPRRMTERQVHDLTQSIQRFGFVEPLVVNSHPSRANIVIGGHQRLAIARLLGLSTVPVLYVSLDEARERELNLRLNRNVGEWDWDMLAGFDASELLEVGFTEKELDFNLDLHLSDDEAPSPAARQAIAVEHICPACGHHWSAK